MTAQEWRAQQRERERLEAQAERIAREIRLPFPGVGRTVVFGPHGLTVVCNALDDADAIQLRDFLIELFPLKKETS